MTDLKDPAQLLGLLRKALTRIEGLERELLAERLERAAEPIAIIGMACRLPGADSPEALWELCLGGKSVIADVPDARWPRLPDGTRDRPRQVPAAALRAGLLDDVRGFDADFFGVSAREARLLDPQQRLLLELTWEVLERGGVVPSALKGSSTGVFVGVTSTDYVQHVTSTAAPLELHAATGNGHCFLAGRLAYTFGFEGPCVALDTACSSSLVAVHQACRSLERGDCGLAVAGGVNLISSSWTAEMVTRTGALSPDGVCRPFDASANGYVRGEGAGLVLLKRLSDARRDGDTIVGLVLGSAINQDGRSAGLTAPSVLAQERVVRQALREAGVSPADIAYLEAHGTGTQLGDPIEVDALARVFGEAPRAAPCVLGSLKSLVGHLEPAAGVAGLIRATLVLRHGLAPPLVGFEQQNPHLAFPEGSLAFPRDATPLPAGVRRCAGVSSFGMSGTNAHVVLAQADDGLQSAERPEGPCVVVLSARTEAALAEAARRHARYFAVTEHAAAACATLNRRRELLRHRLAVSAEDGMTLAERLLELAQGSPARGSAAVFDAEAAPPVAFVFSGEGAEWSGMFEGADVSELAIACEPALRRLGYVGRLEDELAAGPYGAVDVAQRATFILQIAQARRWIAAGCRPALLLGHGVGEVAAAHIAGALALDEALAVLWHRGRLARAAAAPALEAHEDLGRALRPRAGDVPLVSTAAGALVSGANLDAAYWSHQRRAAGRLAEALRAALELGARGFVELGPEAVLTPAIEQLLAAEVERPTFALATARRGARHTFVESAATLLAAGVALDPAVLAPAGRPVSDLPSYPWQRRPYWVDAEAPVADAAAEAQHRKNRGWLGLELSRLDGEARRALLSRHLLEVVAHGLGVPEDAVPRTAALPDLGLDSLLAADLRRRLRHDLALDLPTTFVWEVGSVAGMTDHLLWRLDLGELSPASSRGAGHWWVSLSRDPRPVQLFCLPSAGAGASIYGPLARSLGARGVAVTAAQLPGRETRLHEAAPVGLGEVVDRLYDELRPHTEGRYALFGHSFGGVLAAALAGRLQAQGCRLPERIFLAATPAPRYLLERDLALDSALLEEHLFSRDAARHLERDYRELGKKLLRADLGLLAGFEPTEVLVPLTCIAAEADPLVTLEAARAWSELCRGGLRLHTLPDTGHFFVREHAERLAELVSAELSGVLEIAGGHASS